MLMQLEESVTEWIDQLATGDSAAAQKLWERYFGRLVALARKKLQDLPRRAVDEEDVALSAFASFCHAARQGRFPELHDRNGLWPLLVEITAQKAHNVRRDQRRQKRGGGDVLDEAALHQPAHCSVEAGLEQVAGPEPTPAFAAQVAEEFRRLLDRLGSAALRAVAVGKMEGCSNAEIAARLDCSERTVGRRLRLIRGLWEKERTS
jgi:DNA-directed RNA polymerase specialized sigma24 family protein